MDAPHPIRTVFPLRVAPCPGLLEDLPEERLQVQTTTGGRVGTGQGEIAIPEDDSQCLCRCWEIPADRPGSSVSSPKATNVNLQHAGVAASTDRSKLHLWAKDSSCWQSGDKVAGTQQW